MRGYGYKNQDKEEEMSIWERTIKLALATGLSIFMAQKLGFLYATSAGIIAILSVLDTRRTSFKMARQRLFSAILALILGAVAFGILGYHISAVIVYLLIYVPIAYRYQLEAGIAPSTVLVTHLLLEKSIAWSWLINELGLFIIGAGVALLFNLYMPSRQNEILDYHERVEEQLKKILLRFNSFLLKGDGTNDAQLIKELEVMLQDALALVYLDRRNQLFNQTNYQVHYFEMRIAQTKVLRQMAENINHCHLKSDESLILAQLFQETAEQLSQENPAQDLLDAIEHFLQRFRKRDLPKTREEFETRATLFQLLHDMEHFIQLKVDFYQDYKSEKV